MSTRINLLRNAGAGMFGKISLVLFQLIQVPLLISILGVEDYGRWVVIYSLPSWLILANFGFAGVASNDMSMAVGAGDLSKARSLFSTTFVVLLGIALVVGVMSSISVGFVPWERFLKSEPGRHAEFSFAVFWLILSVVISFQAELFGGRFRAANKSHVAILISSCKPWLDLGLAVVLLQFSSRFDYLAFSIFLSTVTHVMISQYLSWRAFPAISFRRKDVDKSRFRNVFTKGMFFQAFPLGHALLFQGTILVVQSTLGPASVALFGTVRTMVRTLNQGMELINQTVWPELSHLFGSGDQRKIIRLHRTSVILSICIALFGVIGLAIFGPALYTIWVGSTIDLPYHLLLIFLLSIPFNALWITSSVIHMASNQHEGLAKRYLLATAISILLCILLSSTIGIEGAALTSLIVDVMLVPYVLNKSLELTNDTWSGIFRGITEDMRSIKIFLRGLVRS